MARVHEVCGVWRDFSHPWGPEETLGVGRLQRYLKYKAGPEGWWKEQEEIGIMGQRVGKKGG